MVTVKITGPVGAGKSALTGWILKQLLAEGNLQSSYVRVYNNTQITGIQTIGKHNLPKEIQIVEEQT